MANIFLMLPRAVFRLGSTSTFLPHLSQAKLTIGCTLNVRNKVTNQGSVVHDKRKDPKLVPFYWISNIVFFATLCRMRKYPLVITLVGAPLAYGANVDGMVDPDLPIAIAVVGGTFSVVMQIFSLICNRMVAGIYCKADGSQIKITYMDGAGVRCEDLFPVEDLVPLSELPISRLNKFYITLRRHSCKDIYKFVLRPEHILNKELFKHVFKTPI